MNKKQEVILTELLEELELSAHHYTMHRRRLFTSLEKLQLLGIKMSDKVCVQGEFMEELAEIGETMKFFAEGKETGLDYDNPLQGIKYGIECLLDSPSSFFGLNLYRSLSINEKAFYLNKVVEALGDEEALYETPWLEYYPDGSQIEDLDFSMEDLMELERVFESIYRNYHEEGVSIAEESGIVLALIDYFEDYLAGK